MQTEFSLKVGDLVRYADGRFSKMHPNDLAIVLEIACPKGRFVAKLYWQQAMVFENEYLERLIRDEDYPPIGDKKEKK